MLLLLPDGQCTQPLLREPQPLDRVRLAELAPSIDVRADERSVDSARHHLVRVAAGIDMALHRVDRLAGRNRARQVRRGIQYDPRPPG